MSSTDDAKIEELIKSTWVIIKWLISLGLLLVILLSLSDSKPANSQWWSVISTSGCGLLLGGASFAGGGFLGFIFGIPSLLQNQSLTASKPTTFKYNDNLVQISDWLTKIIVGVGLTQLGNIPGKVIEAGQLLAPSFGGGEGGRNAALVIIFYFLLFGFLIIYFWTRTDFTNIMKKTDDDINKIRQDYEEVKQEKEKVEQVNQVMKQENKEYKEHVIQVKSSENIQKSNLVSDVSTLNTLAQDDPELEDKLEQLKEIVKKQLQSRPIKHHDDTQKERWGGRSKNMGKVMEASVTPSSWKNFYNIDIAVYCEDGSLLKDPIAIFVDDTYRIPDSVIYIKPDENGVAKLSLLAFEAYTLGALFLDDSTLELDLNNHPGYPAEFYWNE